MKKQIVYMALMVRQDTHRKVAVKAKQNGMTIDEYINLLLKRTSK